MDKETDIATRNSADHQIQFASGRTIYVEALLGDRWVGRYWNANGRSNWATSSGKRMPSNSRLDISRCPPAGVGYLASKSQ